MWKVLARKNNLKSSKITAYLLIFIFSAIVILTSIFSADNINAVLCGYATKKLPIYRVERDDKLISISFDCAWGNEYTKQLLDVMDEYGVKCTFFTVSFWAEKYQDDLKEIVSRGHEIGTHSKTHSYMSKQGAQAIDEELSYSCKIIENATGRKVTLFRAPYGDYDNLLIERAEKQGLFTIQWDVDSLDWKNLSAKEISLRVISKTKSGSIILCHNNGLHTAESLPLIFADLINKGYKFVKISDLIYKEEFAMLSDGTQVKINKDKSNKE
ncbi:MAG: polysaccharide deacetylase family protein [Clostridia bacterium]|nr:polysaccharide deacetylase family protein [Clostridia bacterium]